MRRILFDVYGTLLDLGAALDPILRSTVSDPRALLNDWRQRQLRYAWLSVLRKEYKPFDVLSQEAFTDALALFKIENPALVDDLMQSVLQAPAFVDAAVAISHLKARGFSRAVLSNGTGDMLDGALRSADLKDYLDEIISVDTIRSYKPMPAAYALGLDHTVTDRKEVTFVSSNDWDIVGAAAFGFSTAWICRDQTAWPPSLPVPDRKFGTLKEFADQESK